MSAEGLLHGRQERGQGSLGVAAGATCRSPRPKCHATLPAAQLQLAATDFVSDIHPFGFPWRPNACAVTAPQASATMRRHGPRLRWGIGCGCARSLDLRAANVRRSAGLGLIREVDPER